MSVSEEFSSCLGAVEALPDGVIVVAVSGGVDSMVLLHAVARVRRPVVAAVFDHQLRAEGADEVEMVRSLAGRLGCQLEAGSGDVRAFAKEKKVSLELAARELRYRFLGDVAERCGATHVATAHHADDQAETVLFHLLRGGGMDALAGMVGESPLPFSNSTQLTRPFLELRKATLLAAAEVEGIEFAEDLSNASAEFSRNRLRNEALPLLNEILGRDVTPPLVRGCQVVAEESEWLDQQADEALAGMKNDAGYPQALSVEGLRDLPAVLRRRALKRWLSDQEVRDFSRRDVLAVERIALGRERPAKVNLTGGRCARRRAGQLFLDRQ